MTTTAAAVVRDHFRNQRDAASQYTANRSAVENTYWIETTNVRRGLLCLIGGHIDEPGGLVYRDLNGRYVLLNVGIRCLFCDRLTLTNGTQLLPGAQ